MVIDYLLKIKTMTAQVVHTGDKLSHIPASFTVIADTPNAPFAGIVHDTNPYYGIQ